MLLNGTDNRQYLSFFFGFGGFLLVLAIIHTVVLPTSAEHDIGYTILEVGLLGGPALGVLGLGYRTTAATIDDDLLRTLVYWCGGGAALLVVTVWLLLFYFGEPLWDHDALFVYHFGFALGAVGGGFVGFHEARAVSRAREVVLTQEQRDRLEYLNHLLRHDILNNLTVIRGNAELALEDVDEDTRDRLETVRRQSEQAAELIQNVRVLVQASRDDQPLTSINLTECIENELAALRDVYPEATITANLPSNVSVRADDLLGSVFENLLRNAIQHNDADTPKVSVTAESREETVTVTITDNGPGIPTDVRDDLFEPSEEGDHGFGMYLVQTLVNRYDGSIALTDTGPDGTTISVELNRA